MKKFHIKNIETPIGTFVTGVLDNKCCMFEFADRGSLDKTIKRKLAAYGAELTEDNHSLFLEIEKQVHLYFEGKITEFEIPLDVTGTEFQLQVWKQLQNIPYGETISYGELANRLNNPKAMRAVGAANGANSIAVIIPCHRVINNEGKLHGYGGGLWRKEKLLELEGSLRATKFNEFFDN